MKEISKPSSLEEFLNIDRWLVKNGLVSESVQENLFAYACLSHPGVITNETEVIVNVKEKVIEFKIAIEKGYTKYMRYKWMLNKLKDSKSIPLLWLKLRIMKKNNMIDVERILKKMVSDYLGRAWTVKVEVSRV